MWILCQNHPKDSKPDTIELKDTEIKDNYKALRNLAQDNLHRTIVRSQYDK